MSPDVGMRKILAEVSLELDRERAGLAIFRQKRPTAVLVLLSIFEIAMLDLLLYDTGYRRQNPGAQPTPMSKRPQWENALSGLVLHAWSNSPPADEYPKLGREVISTAIKAYHYQVKRDEVELAIGGTRLGLNTVRKEGDVIRFERLMDLSEKQEQALLKEMMWESYSERKALNETPPRYPRPPGVGPIEIWTRLLFHQAEELGFDIDTKVGKYTVEQYARCWGALHHLSWQRFKRNMGDATAGPRSVDPILLAPVIPKGDLVSDVAVLANISQELTEAILQDLTYDGSQLEDWLFVKPIVPLYGDLVAIPPSVLINNNVFRNLRSRVARENPGAYAVLTNELGDRMVRNVEGILRRNGYRTRSKLPVKPEAPSVGTDIDVLAKKENTIVVLQIKNINPPDTAKQNENAVREVLNGLEQLRTSVSYVSSHRDKLAKWFGEAKPISADHAEIRDYLITGLRPLMSWSLSSVRESEKITDVVGFEDVLNTSRKKIHHPSPSWKLPTGVMVGKFGNLKIEIEVLRLTPQTAPIVDLNKVIPFDSLLEYLKV